MSEVGGARAESWEDAAIAAVGRAGKNMRKLRIAGVVTQDIHIEDGKVAAFRVRLKVSFKFEGDA